VRGSFGGLWRQYVAYGRAKPEVLRLHPSQLQTRQLVPPGFVLVLACFAGLAAVGRPRPISAVIAVYGAAATFASMTAAARRGVQLLPLLPAVFACMHIAYGLGVLVGSARVARNLLPGARRGAGILPGSEAQRRAD
jgi:hypothetical protein